MRKTNHKEQALRFLEQLFQQVIQIIVFLFLGVFSLFFILLTMAFSLILMIFNRPPKIRVYRNHPPQTPHQLFPEEDENTNEIIDIKGKVDDE